MVPPQGVDWYALLGVTASASPEQVRRAHRERIVQVHPDAGGDVDQAALVNRARDVLMDPHLRRLYDEHRARPKPSGTGTRAPFRPTAAPAWQPVQRQSTWSPAPPPAATPKRAAAAWVWPWLWLLATGVSLNVWLFGVLAAVWREFVADGRPAGAGPLLMQAVAPSGPWWAVLAPVAVSVGAWFAGRAAARTWRTPALVAGAVLWAAGAVIVSAWWFGVGSVGSPALLVPTSLVLGAVVAGLTLQVVAAMFSRAPAGPASRRSS